MEEARDSEDPGVRGARVVRNPPASYKSLIQYKSDQLWTISAIPNPSDKRTSPIGNHNRKESNTKAPSKKKTIARAVQAQRKNL